MPPNLRSRQLNPKSPTPKSTPRKALIDKRSPTSVTVEPSTPKPTRESSNLVSRRRSLRLASKGDSGGLDTDRPPSSSGSTRKPRPTTGKSPIDMVSSEFGVGDATVKGFRDEIVVVSDSDSESDLEMNKKDRKKRKVGDLPGSQVGEYGNENLCLSLRSGARIEKKVLEGIIDAKGDEVLIIESDDDGDQITNQDLVSDGRNAVTGVKRFSREEKGKGVMMDCDPKPNDVSVNLELKLGLLGVNHIDLNVEAQPDLVSDQAQLQVNGAVSDGGSDVIVGGYQLQEVNNQAPFMMVGQRMRQLKEIAKQNATRFARISSEERVENAADSDAEGEVAAEEAGEDVEDWPGPFSTAMKIIRDRQNKSSFQAQMGKSGDSRIVWCPKIDESCDKKTRIVPSLKDLSMKVLVSNSDAITSLECVPDVLVHKLVSMLCNSRKMTGDILDLLFRGSPSEICITDCSWIEEEQFTKSFKACNTENLMVLQLDQCGRCMPDYIVLETLTSKGLPVLTNLSLKGACRLSDNGLKAIVSSATALKSLNLSQCSLITDAGINAIADSLGSGLRELYLDDCQSLNVMLILPGLEKFINLELLSLVGIPSVCDKFLKQLLGSIGRNIKELALADCVKLSDSSMKAISNNCSQLCALDLMNITKLTDSGIGYLANCCQAIQTLKLCRNTLSDEAIAAFLETCGESLKELSLNNVREVGPETCISISRRCKNLVSLDMSWCRNVTDDCLGLIADSCASLRVLKIFGCTQITRRFWAGHSNEYLGIVGIKMTPILENLKERDLLQGPLRYSAVNPW